MSISMTEYLNRKGSGLEVNPQDVTLSMNDLGKLQRLQAIDPMNSPYIGSNVAQAQGFTSDLPMASDLGLMLQQNRQIEAAGGRGYAGNVHNLQGQTTPFEKLAQSVSSNTRPSEESLNPNDGAQFGMNAGERNNDQATSADVSGISLGPYATSTLSNAAQGYGLKGLTGFGMARALGAPLGLSTKFGITSAIPGPLGALGLIGSLAYSGLLDKAYTDEMGSMGLDASAVDQEAVESVMEDAQQARALGMHQAEAYENQAPGVAEAASVQQRTKDRGFLGRLGLAYDTLKNTDWGASTNVNLGGLTLNEKLAAKAMADPNIAGVMGLDPSFGGGGGNQGGAGGTSGGGMSDAGGFGTGDKGDREGGGWV